MSHSAECCAPDCAQDHSTAHIRKPGGNSPIQFQLFSLKKFTKCEQLRNWFILLVVVSVL